jgi:hypothetical protein
MRNRYFYWAYLPTSSPEEYRALSKLAEGEELGSNLLRVTQRSLGDSGGLGRFSGKCRRQRSLQQPKGGPPDTRFGACTGPKALAKNLQA